VNSIRPVVLAWHFDLINLDFNMILNKLLRGIIRWGLTFWAIL